MKGDSVRINMKNASWKQRFKLAWLALTSDLFEVTE